MFHMNDYLPTDISKQSNVQLNKYNIKCCYTSLFVLTVKKIKWRLYRQRWWSGRGMQRLPRRWGWLWWWWGCCRCCCCCHCCQWRKYMSSIYFTNLLHRQAMESIIALWGVWNQKVTGDESKYGKLLSISWSNFSTNNKVR